ncbi:MAG: hypothetical protein WD470_00615 [Rhodospirillaceae bacterium]
MNDSDMRGPGIRKIAVAFDPACGAPALLEAAAQIAAALGAELEALFVDDADIIRLSQLPFGRMVMLGSGKAERFDEPALASRRAGHAARTRTILRQLSRLHSFAYTVREMHGRALVDAASETTAELLVVAAFHAKFGGARHVDEDAVRIAAASPRSVLLVSRFPVSAHGILAVTDESEIGRRATEIAARVARRSPFASGMGIERLTVGGQDEAAMVSAIRAAAPTLVVLGIADRALMARLQQTLQDDGISLLTVR